MFSNLLTLLNKVLNECYIYNDTQLADKLMQLSKIFFYWDDEQSVRVYINDDLKKICCYWNNEFWFIQVKTKIKEINQTAQNLVADPTLSKSLKPYKKEIKLYLQYFAGQMEIFGYSQKAIIALFKQIYQELNLQDQKMLYYIEKKLKFRKSTSQEESNNLRISIGAQQPQQKAESGQIQQQQQSFVVFDQSENNLNQE
eukprot:TRINITY_DN8583_c0_g1_i1.p2 TRINITY_DN8583_c0_g1~~TRINITY_DN8583_c0_g1_i1.p2  ORF type:complete len:199 (+),score=28.23 TRINITY_DN8583_c0_g1_i1:261-857(+)